MEDRVELRVVKLSGGLTQTHAYIMLLGEVDGGRQMPVVVGPAEAQAIALALKGYTPPRPFTHDLFVSLCSGLSVRLDCVYIYKVKEGVFYSYLYFTNNGERICIDSRTSDAVALALRFQAPIYTSQQIIEKECVDWSKEGVPVSISITAITVEQLEESLQKAIDEENYELAAQIRDEINRRNQGTLTPDDDIFNL